MLSRVNPLHRIILTAGLLSFLGEDESIAQKYDALRQSFVWESRQTLASKSVQIDLKNSFIKKSARQHNVWQNTGPEGGIVWTIKTFDQDPSIVLIGTTDGGLYKSADGGLNWRWCGPPQIIASEYGIGQFITDIKFFDEKVYAGGSRGLYMSPDLGETWSPLYQTISGTLTGIAINPANPKIIYISYYRGGGLLSKPGVIKSLDGGKTWFTINEGLLSTDVTDLKMSGRDPERLFAATLNGIFMTVNGGASGWKDISGNLAGLPAYAIIPDQARDSVMYAGTMTGVFKTLDVGHNWMNITGANFKNRFIRPNGLVVNNGVIWAGTENGLYRSTDGGTTWQEKVAGLDNTAILSIEAITLDHLRLGTGDGFYQSRDGGDSWHKSSRGIFAFENTALAFDTRTNPSRLFVAARSAGLYFTGDAGEHWQDIGMDTGFTYISSLALLPESQEIMYAGFMKPENSKIQSGVYKSTNGGKSWQLTGFSLESSLINSILINPASSRILYVGTWNGIFKSIDAGTNWQQKDQGLDFKSVSPIAIDSQNPNLIYAGTEGGDVAYRLGIYRSTDGGEFWQYSSDGLPVFPNGRRDIFDLCLNPLNPRTIYAALGSSGVFKTNDGGRSWFNVHRKDGEFITSVTIDHQDTARLYIAGQKIYRSDDAGQTWQEMREGLPEYFGYINRIRVDPNDPRRIYAATYGYGVLRYYRTATAVEEPGASAPNASALHQNYPNPFNPSTTITFQIRQAGKVAIRIHDVHGRLVRTLLDEHKPAGEFSVIWNGRDDTGQRVASGIYVYRLTAGNFAEAKKMILLQ